MGKLFDKACEFAIEKHSEQKRKDGSIYVLHPFEVATIATTMTLDENVLCAAVLHDTVEDTNVTFEELNELFGPEVTKYVVAETEQKFPDLTKEESWIMRKQTALNKLENNQDINYKILYLSDKLANVRSLYRDYSKLGLEAFNKFNVKDVNLQAWFYYGILDRLKELEQFEAYKEFETKINIIFEKVRRKEDDKNNYSL